VRDGAKRREEKEEKGRVRERTAIGRPVQRLKPL